MATLATLVLACPVHTPAPGNIDFYCTSQDDCLSDYRCVQGLCTPVAETPDATVTDAAMTDVPTTDTPMTDVPMTDAAMTDVPTTDTPMTDAPMADVPMTDVPMTDTPMTDRPMTDRPMTDAAMTDAAMTDAAMTDAPTTDTPTTDAPTTDTPMADVPTTDTAMPDAAMPDTAMPDTAMPDAARPDTARPDTARPDTARPDTSPPGDWWDGDWTWRRKLVFDNSAQAEALDDFPVLVSVDSNRIDYGQVRNLGQDLRFVDADGSGPLAHEVEHWNETGVSAVWVRVPRIDASSATDHIWMYYGNNLAPDGQDIPAVWSNGYVGVWHLDDNPSGGSASMSDSSPSAAHGTALNMSVGDRVPGAIGRALDFSGSGDVVGIEDSWQAGHPLDIVGGPMTISLWALPQGSGQGSMVAKRNHSNSQWQFQAEHWWGSGDFNPGVLWTTGGGSMYGWGTDQAYDVGSWYNLGVTLDSNGRPFSFFVDGAVVPHSVWNSGAGDPSHRDINVAIGARWAGPPSTGFGYSGVIDEVRVASVARSEAWMAAQHLSTSDNFVSFADLEQR